MREDEFRDRLRDALGEPPPMPAPRLGPAPSTPRLYPRAMGLVAFALAVLLVVVLVASRLTFHTRSQVLPAATPSTKVAQPALDSFPCYLPVQMTQEAGNQGQRGTLSSTAGFINLPDGNFTADTHAAVTDLPGPADRVPGTYSVKLHRWLPASITDLSPDGLSYLYVKQLGSAGSELHVVDTATRADRTLWTTSESAGFWSWNSAGILVSTSPPNGGIGHAWRIDPATGTATAASQSEIPGLPSQSLVASLGGGQWGTSGTDGVHLVLRQGTAEQGTSYSIFIVEGGAATKIYSGTNGDATDFYPEGIYVDAHGFWFGNHDGTRMWLWKQESGLRDFKVTGAPPAPAGYQFYFVTFYPAGPCIPGTFAGSGA